MQADIAQKRDALAAVCRHYGVARLEVFGSAARSSGFDPDRRPRRARGDRAEPELHPPPGDPERSPNCLWVNCPSGMRRYCSTCCSRHAMRRALSKGSTKQLFLRAGFIRTIRSLEVLGEAAGKVSAATQAGHPDIPWREITAMRHRLIHGYGEVRLDLVWMVVRDRLGPLITKLVGLVPGESEEER
jgi:uncharacterized protein with HEPN domain